MNSESLWDYARRLGEEALKRTVQYDLIDTRTVGDAISIPILEERKMKWSDMSDEDKLELVKEILARAYCGRNGATSSKSWSAQDLLWYREDALDAVIKLCKEAIE